MQFGFSFNKALLTMGMMLTTMGVFGQTNNAPDSTKAGNKPLKAPIELTQTQKDSIKLQKKIDKKNKKANDKATRYRDENFQLSEKGERSQLDSLQNGSQGKDYSQMIERNFPFSYHYDGKKKAPMEIRSYDPKKPGIQTPVYGANTEIVVDQMKLGNVTITRSNFVDNDEPNSAVQIYAEPGKKADRLVASRETISYPNLRGETNFTSFTYYVPAAGRDNKPLHEAKSEDVILDSAIISTNFANLTGICGTGTNQMLESYRLVQHQQDFSKKAPLPKSLAEARKPKPIMTREMDELQVGRIYSGTVLEQIRTSPNPAASLNQATAYYFCQNKDAFLYSAAPGFNAFTNASNNFSGYDVPVRGSSGVRQSEVHLGGGDVNQNKTPVDNKHYNVKMKDGSGNVLKSTEDPQSKGTSGTKSTGVDVYEEPPLPDVEAPTATGKHLVTKKAPTPVVKQPVVKQPVVKQPVVKQPVEKQPVVQSHADVPVVNQTVAKKDTPVPAAKEKPVDLKKVVTPPSVAPPADWVGSVTKNMKRFVGMQECDSLYQINKKSMFKPDHDFDSRYCYNHNANWCALFVQMGLQDANPFKHTPLCADMVQQAQEKQSCMSMAQLKKWKAAGDPRYNEWMAEGNVVVLARPNKKGHTGYISEIDGEGISIIHGNNRKGAVEESFVAASFLLDKGDFGNMGQAQGSYVIHVGKMLEKSKPNLQAKPDTSLKANAGMAP